MYKFLESKSPSRMKVCGGLVINNLTSNNEPSSLSNAGSETCCCGTGL